MKTPKKSVKKPVVKGKSPETDASKKTKLKPVNPKETKNWKNKLDDEDDDDDLSMPIDELDEYDSPHAFDENFEDEDERF